MRYKGVQSVKRLCHAAAITISCAKDKRLHLCQKSSCWSVERASGQVVTMRVLLTADFAAAPCVNRQGSTGVKAPSTESVGLQRRKKSPTSACLGGVSAAQCELACLCPQMQIAQQHSLAFLERK